MRPGGTITRIFKSFLVKSETYTEDFEQITHEGRQVIYAAEGTHYFKDWEEESKDLDNAFIPVVSLDKTYPQNGFKLIEKINKKTTKRSNYLDADKQDQPLEKLSIRADEVILRFCVKQGNLKANDNKGKITAMGVGVTILSSIQVTVKYGWKLLLKISSKDLKNDAYIDFFADDNDWYYYSVTNVFCGRIQFEKCCELVKINRLIENGLSGLNDPNRNCAMCCLRALASNLKALYGLPQTAKITTTGTLSSAITSLDAKYYKRIQNIAPTYKGKRLTSRSHGNIDSDRLGKQGSDIVTNITSKLVELTEKGCIRVFAVGMGAEYHSTIVVVTKDSVSKLKIGKLEITGTDSAPSFIYIEDGGGARDFKQSEFERKMQEWIYSARKFYRGDKIVAGAINGNKSADASIDSTIFELLKICDC